MRQSNKLSPEPCSGHRAIKSNAKAQRRRERKDIFSVRYSLNPLRSLHLRVSALGFIPVLYD